MAEDATGIQSNHRGSSTLQEEDDVVFLQHAHKLRTADDPQVDVEDPFKLKARNVRDGKGIVTEKEQYMGKFSKRGNDLQDACLDSTETFQCVGAISSSRCSDDTSGDMCSNPIFGQCWTEYCHAQCGCQFTVLSDLGQGSPPVAECPAGSVLERCEKVPDTADVEVEAVSVTECSVTAKSTSIKVRAKAICGNVTLMTRGVASERRRAGGRETLP